MSRYYYHPEIDQSAVLTLSCEESLHLKANRIQPGTEILLSDGLGNMYSGIFKGFVSKKAQVEVVKKVKNEVRDYQLWLWQPLLKNWSRMDWVIEKLVEIGVTGIGIFYSERCIPERVSSIKEERWRKIIIEASKQSGRIYFPVFKVIINFNDFLAQCRSNNMDTIIGDFNASDSIWNYLKNHSYFPSLQIIIGPEGDFTKDEKEQLQSLPNSQFLKFSKQILRSETASLYASMVSMASLELKRESCY